MQLIRQENVDRTYRKVTELNSYRRSILLYKRTAGVLLNVGNI